MAAVDERNPVRLNVDTTQSLSRVALDERDAACRALCALLVKDATTISKAWARRHLLSNEIRQFFASVNIDVANKDQSRVYQSSYILPLLAVLKGALATGDQAWRAVYLDERTRFLVPADVAHAAHEGVLAELLNNDVKDLVGRLPPKNRFCADQLLSELHGPLTHRPITSPVRLLAIGDCVITEIRAFLVGRCRELQADVRVRHQYLNYKTNSRFGLSDALEHLSAGSTDMVALSLFTFEGLPVYRALLADAARLSSKERDDRVTLLLRTAREIITSIRSSSDAPILFHNASGLPLNKFRRRLPMIPSIGRKERDVLKLLNEGICELTGNLENVVLIDEVAAVKSRGLRHAASNYFPRKLRKTALFHTSAFGAIIAEHYASIVLAYAQLKKTKVLLVDFDNTLWSGIMAEGEVAHDLRAQKILRKLREAGILLVALSKNNSHAIRWNEMYLKADDFVLHKVNWNQKVQSIHETAQQLDVGLDSFTVIDDNPVERALISDRFPEVRVLDSTDANTWKSLELMLSFPNTRQTEEAASRTSLYRDAAQRREAMVADLDYPQMMRSLELHTTVQIAGAKDLNRVHELLSRTNQFNTTTMRRNATELRSLIADPRFKVFVCSLGDRFGQLGLVGVVILELQRDLITFDSVVMSCRAMGFGLEALLVAAPLQHMFAAAGMRLKARGLFRATERNGPCSTLFQNCGFVVNEKAEWILAAEADLPSVPEWLTVTK